MVIDFPLSFVIVRFSVLISFSVRFVLREPVPRLIDNTLAYQIDNVNGRGENIFRGLNMCFCWGF